MGRYEEAQAVGLDALAPGREARPHRAGLRRDHHAERAARRPGPRSALRAALVDAVAARPRTPARCTPSCAAASCSAAPTRTGPSSTRPSAGSAAPSTLGERRRRRRGRRTRFEARWQLAWVLQVARATGTSALALCDVRRPAAAADGSARCWTALRVTVEVARGDDVTAEPRGRCAASGRGRAGSPSTPAAAAIRMAGRRGDPAGGRGGVRRRGHRADRDLARVVQRPDPAGRRRARGARRRRGRDVGGRAGVVPRPGARGCTPTAARCSTATPTRRASGGPRAAPGCSGSTPSGCGCAGWRGSTPRRSTCCVGAWREDASRFEEFGDVHELARSRTVLAGILRAAGDPAGGPRAGRPGPGRRPYHPAWFRSLFVYAIAQVRMFRDLEAGFLHDADLLGLRHPDRRHGRPRHVRPGPHDPRLRRSTAGCGG